MDPAFLRRLALQDRGGSASLENFKTIFPKESEKQGMPLADEVFNYIVHKITHEKEMEFAAYMPRFIVDQVVATCRFMGQTPHFEPRYIDYALDNLRVKSSAAKKGAKTSARITDKQAVAIS